MREFNVLPTEQRFKDLDDYQIEFIIANMNLDTKEMMEARDGKNYDMKAEDTDTSWFEAPTDEFDVVPDFLDLDDLNTQVDKSLSEKEKIERDRRVEAELEDETEGLTTQHLAMMEHIRQKQKELDESLGLDIKETTQEDINKAIEDVDDWYM